MQNWRVSGSYFEVCNCDAPCPCRRLGDKPAGRSLYDTCDFALRGMIAPAGNLSRRLCECPMARCIGWWKDAVGSPHRNAPISFTFQVG